VVRLSFSTCVQENDKSMGGRRISLDQEGIVCREGGIFMLTYDPHSRPVYLSS
jgi:hypothetical protein